MTRAFSRKVVEDLRPMDRRFIASVLDRIEDQGEVEFFGNDESFPAILTRFPAATVIDKKLTFIPALSFRGLAGLLLETP